MNDAGCIYTTNVVVEESPLGPLFALINNLLTLKGTARHGGSNPQAGINLSSSGVFDYSTRCPKKLIVITESGKSTIGEKVEAVRKNAANVTKKNNSFLFYSLISEGYNF